VQDNNTTPSTDAPTPTAPELSPAPGATPVVPPVPEQPEFTTPVTPTAEAASAAAATAPAAAAHVPGAKNHLVALLLSIFLGNLGIDRFYLGHIGVGVAKLLLCWLTFGIWWIIDVILIATRKVNNVTWDN